jgi:uncharacterized protein YkwD
MLLIPANAAAAPIIDVVKAVAPQGKTPAGVAITASDPSGAPVNSVRVDRADGGGSFAESSCRVTRSGKYTPVGGAFEVPIPGGTGGDVVVSVGTGTCVPVVPGQPAPQPQTTSQGYSLQLPRADEVAPPLVPLPQLPTLPLPVPDPKLPIARASAGCANADLAIVGRTRKLVRKAIICLVNVERAKVGARKVRSNLKLQKAGAAHAADMRRRSYFAHEGPGGPDLVSRLRKARFWPATAGENLGAATGGLSTARAVVDAWMHSEGHRVNMLDKRFRYLGIGIEPMFPAPPEAPGATIAAEFGVR